MSTEVDADAYLSEYFKKLFCKKFANSQIEFFLVNVINLSNSNKINVNTIPSTVKHCASAQCWVKTVKIFANKTDNMQILLILLIIINVKSLPTQIYINTRINANIIGVNIKTKGTIHQYFTTD